MSDDREKRLRVLIVEDSLIFRRVLRLGVERRFPAVEVLEAGGVEEGYRTAMERKPNAVFIDVGLPDGNGLDLMTRLRAELPGAALAVCTMHDMPEYRQAALRRGARAFYVKQRMDWNGVYGFVRGALARHGDGVEPAAVLDAALEAEADLWDQRSPWASGPRN